MTAGTAHPGRGESTPVSLKCGDKLNPSSWLLPYDGGGERSGFQRSDEGLDPSALQTTFFIHYKHTRSASLLKYAVNHSESNYPHLKAAVSVPSRTAATSGDTRLSGRRASSQSVAGNARLATCIAAGKLFASMNPVGVHCESCLIKCKSNTGMGGGIIPVI